MSAKVVERADKKTLHQFLKDRAAPGAKVYTDDYVIYRDLPFDHEAVLHLTGEYVRGDAHTNGIESFWSMLKAGAQGNIPQDQPKIILTDTSPNSPVATTSAGATRRIKWQRLHQAWSGSG